MRSLHSPILPTSITSRPRNQTLLPYSVNFLEPSSNNFHLFLFPLMILKLSSSDFFFPVCIFAIHLMFKFPHDMFKLVMNGYTALCCGNCSVLPSCVFSAPGFIIIFLLHSVEYPIIMRWSYRKS
uniref:Uncharacterized protein n=1 Tax=Cacopsylla melanoneura TaxID=428564 RepID=A0A8D9DQF2_9HEMI